MGSYDDDCDWSHVTLNAAWRRKEWALALGGATLFVIVSDATTLASIAPDATVGQCAGMPLKPLEAYGKVKVLMALSACRQAGAPQPLSLGFVPPAAPVVGFCSHLHDGLAVVDGLLAKELQPCGIAHLLPTWY